MPPPSSACSRRRASQRCCRSSPACAACAWPTACWSRTLGRRRWRRWPGSARSRSPPPAWASLASTCWAQRSPACSSSRSARRHVGGWPPCGPVGRMGTGESRALGSQDTGHTGRNRLREQRCPTCQGPTNQWWPSARPSGLQDGVDARRLLGLPGLTAVHLQMSRVKANDFVGAAGHILPQASRVAPGSACGGAGLNLAAAGDGHLCFQNVVC